MKKSIFILFSLFLTILFISCELFSKPMYTISRDISGVLGSISTEDLAGNIDKLATDPQKTADILNELAGRNQDEISGLSLREKEKLLEAGVGAIIPTSKLGEMVDALLNGSDVDAKKIVDTLCGGTPDVNTKALETALRDPDVLANTDASTLTMSAASLIVATVKSETKDGSVDGKMDAFTAAVEAAGGTENFNETKFKDELEKGGFSDSSISSLTTAMDTARVLTGTAGADKPNRKADAENIEFGGYSLKDLLDEMTGEKA